MTSTLAGFADLGVPAPLVTALDRSGITTPFPIQSATLPDSLAGRDVLGRGRTGSGKTIAFGLPMLAALATSKMRREPSRPRALVLVPTRELANQVADALTPLARALSLNVTTVIGGAGQRPQVDSLRRGTDVLVACPGRLEDLIRQRHCRLDRVEVTVVDEADLMADLGFLPAVQRLLDQTPKGGQRLLFSATLDHGIDGLVRRYLNDPVTHAVDSEASAPPELDHHVLTVSTGDKPAIVHQLASGNQRALLFTRTKHGAKKLAARLSAAGIPTTELHGNLAQAARERNLAAFADGSARVLVATDIASRGIHVDDIALVVHVDPPAEHKAYLHRSGRTARAGASGIVVTVATPEQVKGVHALARLARVHPTTTKVTPGHSLLQELSGPPQALSFTPAAKPVPSKPLATRPRRPEHPRRTGRTRTARGSSRSSR
jgi:superfamily II DNA/RNA helicase